MTTNVLPFEDHSAIQAQARQWLIRLDRDDPPSKKELQQLRAWAAQSPAHQAELTRISAFWDQANVLTELSTPVYNHGRFSIAKLFNNLFVDYPKTAALAASTCLALAIVFTLLPNPSDSTNGMYVSALGEVTEHKLVDGSVIQLNTDSQVQVTYSDGTRKMRLLRGEAYFEVAPNKQWPFEVYAGKGRVKALGTAFSVRLNQAHINVTVSHGRVELASQIATGSSDPAGSSGNQPATASSQPRLSKITDLQLGQSASFKNAAIQPQLLADSSTHQHLQSISTASEQELARKLAWRTGYLVFAGDPLSYVVAEINRYTPVTIEIADPQLQQLRVGGRFKVGELNAMLDVLQTSFGVQVSHINDQHIQLQAP